MRQHDPPWGGGPVDGTPLGGLGVPSVRRALRTWVERQRGLGLGDGFIRASALLLDCLVRFFGVWRGTYAAEMLQNRIKGGVPELYHVVVESPHYQRRWHRFVEACAPVLGLVAVDNLWDTPPLRPDPAGAKASWRIYLSCRDEAVWRGVDEGSAAVQRSVQEQVVAIVRDLLAAEGRDTRWAIRPLAVRLRDSLGPELWARLRARHGGPLSSRWLFNVGTIMRYLPRVLVKHPDLFVVSRPEGADGGELFVALR